MVGRLIVFARLGFVFAVINDNDNIMKNKRVTDSTQFDLYDAHSVFCNTVDVLHRHLNTFFLLLLVESNPKTNAYLRYRCLPPVVPL